MKTISPGQLVWQRFRKNGLAFAGLLLIAVAVFVAVFCYVLIPDATPNANRMCLPVNNRPPGFTVNMLRIPSPAPEVDQSFFTQILLGKKDVYDFIPVDSAWCNNGTIQYKPYSDGSLQLLVKAFSPKGSSANDYLKENLISRTFWLGTDRYGRDMLSRLLAGTRVTFLVGLVAVIISLLVGVTLGGLAGYFRGNVDKIILWLINVIWSVPTLLLVIAITLVLGKGFTQVFIAVGLTMWVDVARIVRSQLFSVRELDFVSAGRTMGFSDFRILFRHMLPNVFGPVLVVAASNFSTAILLEAGLSFLGIGAQPPTPSWGAMIKENYGFIILPDSAFLAILPGLAIVLLTLAFTFVANGLRDAMDARKQLIG
jgi:peptide/nickel transport system permease protein